MSPPRFGNCYYIRIIIYPLFLLDPTTERDTCDVDAPFIPFHYPIYARQVIHASEGYDCYFCLMLHSIITCAFSSRLFGKSFSFFTRTGLYAWLRLIKINDFRSYLTKSLFLEYANASIFLRHSIDIYNKQLYRCFFFLNDEMKYESQFTPLVFCLVFKRGKNSSINICFVPTNFQGFYTTLTLIQ